MKILKLCLLLFACVQYTYGASPCDINFVKYVNGEMPADLASNPTINMWDERFDPNVTLEFMKKSNVQQQRAYLNELSKLVYKDQEFNKNLSLLITKMHQEKIIDKDYILKNFINKEFNHVVFYYSKLRKEVSAQLSIDPEKYEYIKKIVKESGLSKFYQSEYSVILMHSGRNLEDLELAVKSRMKFRGDKRSINQFKNYIEFLDYSRDRHIGKGLKNIEEIYDFDYKHGVLPFNPLLSPHKKFLDQTSRLKKFVNKRTLEIERGFKLQQKSEIVDEIDRSVKRERSGGEVSKSEKRRFRKKIDDQTLPKSLKRRALAQAKHESQILRRLQNGCNTGSSKRIKNAGKKFSMFKFGLSFLSTPYFYLTKNYDKRETDPYFKEKLGHEMSMGLILTYVSNKIVINTNTTFLKKYFQSYLKFGALSYGEALSYEALFGLKSYVRHFQKIYKPDVPDSELDIEFEKFKNSPTFEKDVTELFAYLDEMSKKNNTKNFFDKHFNLSAYSSLDEDLKITQEDLESEEAREVMMELLAERIYLKGMGDWPIFQTGGKDTDRFAFYRARDVLWDIKGLIFNLAIFELICREPLGKIGSWGLIFSMVVANTYITGDLTYGYRREMINQ